MNTSLAKYTILVVEDDPAMLQVLVGLFKKEGANTLSAANGKLALEVLAENQVDLVISDVQMPVMDGVELLKRIRAINPDIPLVLLATGESQVDEATAISLGASGLMHKPFIYKDLKKRILDLVTAKEKNATAS